MSIIFEDDNLINLIKEELNEDDNKLFKMSYQLYNISYNKPNEYIINLDDVYNWIGFKYKANAKKLLVSNFKENIDYKMNKEVFIQTDENLGGRPTEKILLTIECFKKFCLKSSTSQAGKIYDYYIKMEKIIFKYIQDQYNNQCNIILEKNKALEMKDKIIEEKEIEINKIKNKKIK